MNGKRLNAHLRTVIWFGVVVIGVRFTATQEAASLVVAPSKMPAIGTVDARFLSYAIDTSEVVGGRTFDPARLRNNAQGANPSSTPAQSRPQFGGGPSLGDYRKPLDLSDPRLRKLALALSPAYVRISGTARNSTYFQDDDKPALEQAPLGFGNVLTRAEWKGVIDFSKAAGAEIMTSFSMSPGTDDSNGVWTPTQAKAIFDYTHQLGATIAATEFMNEPTFAIIGGAPKGYDASAFARDAKLFGTFLRKESPKTVYLGPGGVLEGASLMTDTRQTAGAQGFKLDTISTEDIMKVTGPIFDAFSYHFYGAVAHRCMGTLTVGQSMTAEWLDKTDTVEAFYGGLRDKYLPGKPLWISETSQAGCGGDELSAQFVDTFRFLNQFGTLAQKNVKIIVHQTLIGSNYGFVNQHTHEPIPNYWAAVLWKRTMGTKVLDPGVAKGMSTRIYAQCMKGTKGGVTLLALNLADKTPQELTVPEPAERYTLTAPDLSSAIVLLNGTALKAAADGTLPDIKGQPVGPGELRLEPLSITFLTIARAGNPNCK